MISKIRVLYIDDSPYDQQLISDSLLNESDNYQLVATNNRESFEQHLNMQDFDIVLSDFNILGFDGLQVLEIVKQKDPAMPVIIVTGTGSEEIAIKAIRKGAADYIIKTASHIKGLPHTIENVLNKQFAEEETRKVNEKYRLFFEEDLTGDFIATVDGRLIDCNPSYLKMLKFKDKKQAMGYDLKKIYPPDANHLTFLEKIAKEKRLENYEYQLVRLDGEIIHVIANIIGNYDKDGKLESIKGYLIDNTNRKLAEIELIKSNKKLKELNNYFVGRELKMVELKKEINNLLAELGRKKKYDW